MIREEGSCPAGNYRLCGWVPGVIFLVWFVFIKKIIKSIFFKKTEISSNRPVSVRFGYFRTKTIFFGLAWLFWFDSVFPV